MNIKKISISLCGLLLAGACTFDFPESVYQEPSSGSANFTKTVTIGSSLMAGFMNGALYNAGQSASFAKILTGQLTLAGGGNFNQPDINAVNGCYNPLACGVAGRLYLKGLVSPKPTPKSPGDAITPYTGDKAALNNFSAYGISIQLSLAAATSGPPSSNPYYNPWFARFASSPSVNGITGSSIISDAATALGSSGTFFVFWLGADDALGYAINGADQADATRPLTSTPAFTAAYTAALDAILGSNANTKGLVGNIPDITSLPHFTTVAYNPIPLDAIKAGELNKAFQPYNFVMNSTKAAILASPATFNLSAAQATALGAEIDTRLISFIAGNNKPIIVDETLFDLGVFWDAFVNAGQMTAQDRAKLVPYEQVRQTTSTDLIPLGTAVVLGTLVNNDPTLLNGLTVPLVDKYILLPSEITQIQSSISAFNAHIESRITASSGRIALFDVKAILSGLKASPASINGSSLTSSITPPFGGFSLDGVHPNARGNAYLANKAIELINSKFGSTVPLCNPNDYAGNEIPVP